MLAQPPNTFVASLAGLNLLEGTVADGVFTADDIALPAPDVDDGSAWAAFPPTALYADANGEYSLQAVAAEGGGFVLATTGTQRVRVSGVAGEPAPGASVRCHLDHDAVSVYTRI